ncbi:MAG TPA: hypothetical protein P5084_05905 [Paludibacter sp.]|nr:hypothetical protein [Paludibacter sp.]
MRTLIEEYNQILKEILDGFAIKWNPEKRASDIRVDVMTFYGFEMKFGWNILLNAIYIIDDSELAKESFNKFDLQGPARHSDIGERYLRLSGVLNAAYQQKLAIQNLIELFKLQNKKKYLERFSKNELIVLRNKIAAHSVNYNEINKDSEYKFDVFEISRQDLKNGKIKLLRNQQYFEDYDINKVICDFDKLIIEILSLLIGKLIKKKYNNQGVFYEKYQQLNIKKEGGLILGNTIIRFQNFDKI